MEINESAFRDFPLLEKLGFSRVAHLRENFYFNGAFTDTVIYDLLRREWA